MTHRIVIENGQAKFTSYRDIYSGKEHVQKLVNASDFVDQIQGNDIVYPDDTKYFQKLYDEQYIVVIQKPPALRVLSVEMAMNYRWAQLRKWAKLNNVEEAIDYTRRKFGWSNFTYREVHRFQILHPYMIFIFHVNMKNGGHSTKVNITNKPLTSLNDVVYLAPFYNITGKNRVCMRSHELAQMYGDRRPKKLTLSESVNMIIGSFWNSYFNSDYNGNIKSYKDIPEYSNLFIWDFLSNNYPDKLMEARMVPYTKLKNVITVASGGRSRRTEPIKTLHLLMKPEVRKVAKKRKATKKKLP